MSITDRARAEAEGRWLRFPVGSPWRTVARDVRYGFRLGAEWAASQPVTDEEVLAALNAQGVAVAPKMHPAPPLDYWGDKPVEAMRAALTAAREAQR